MMLPLLHIRIFVHLCWPASQIKREVLAADWVSLNLIVKPERVKWRKKSLIKMKVTPALFVLISISAVLTGINATQKLQKALAIGTVTVFNWNSYKFKFKVNSCVIDLTQQQRPMKRLTWSWTKCTIKEFVHTKQMVKFKVSRHKQFEFKVSKFRLIRPSCWRWRNDVRLANERIGWWYGERF